MIGPAIAGVLIAWVGSGGVFLINAVSFVAVLGSLVLMRAGELHPQNRVSKTPGSLIEGFRYVRRRPDLLAILVMLFWISTFGLNFPIFISTMSVTTFHDGASLYGVLTTMMATGSVTGALLAANQVRPSMRFLLAGATIFGIGCALAALMPNHWLFGLTLVFIGASAQTFTTSANSMVQLSTESGMRGRVMAIFMAIVFGTTPLGSPFVGWVADTFSPRWALGVAAASGFAAVFVGIRYLVRYRHLRIRFGVGHVRFTLDADPFAVASKPGRNVIVQEIV